ncbi:MAG TPA: ATP-binding protein [Gemmatimonadaceae bacterium]|jgi:signal transduction histidine kinase/HAMP domain-containing protein
MKLANRLLLSSLAVIIALTITVALILDRQLHQRMAAENIAELAREAQFVAAQWTPAVKPLELAHAAGRSLGHRVTLIRRDGVVLGDSQFDSAGVAGLQNHSHRPEVMVAFAGGIGSSRRTSPSEGDDEVYVAVPAELGVARVSQNTASADAIFDRALGDVAFAGAVAATIALLLAALFARSVSRPVIELRDAARAIADGDLSRHPPISAPGEIGDLATALYSMSEQLGARLKGLADEESLLSAVVEALSEGILAVSARRSVLRINTAARTMLGLHEPVPFSADHIPRERVLQDALEEALRGHSTDDQSIEVAGRMIAVAARALPDGGAVLALADLTAKRRLEAVRRDFVANVSHELRTPLTVIGGFAETLAEPTLSDADRRRFAALIQSNTARMQRIVDELLDLSRIESGGWVPRPENVDVAAVAAEAIASVTKVAASNEVVTEAQVAKDARWVYADRTALRQVIGNLVENAVRHTFHGTVTVFARRDDDGYTWLGVRDSGVGIAPAHLPRIFERFYRADSARSRESGGTGLGLAIVKHLVEAHGGQVRAESVLGRGTTVSASFPPAVSSRREV